jgi:hypothetical protein
MMEGDMRNWLIPWAVLGSLTTTLVWAGPYADAETALRGAYGHYRIALFATNMGKPEKAAAELAAFDAAWLALQPQLAAAPQYEGDPALSETFTKVDGLAKAAADAVAAGNMEKAHETLEGIRGEIAGLHDRAGMIGFSDRMNAYHAAMETALALTPDQLASPAGLEAAAEQAGLLAAYAADIAAHPAPEANSADYQPLAEAFQISVNAFVDAVRAGDVAALQTAIGGLKPAYSKFFVEFG